MTFSDRVRMLTGGAFLAAVSVGTTYGLLYMFTDRFRDWFIMGPFVWLIILPCLWATVSGAFCGLVLMFQSFLPKGKDGYTYIDRLARKKGY